MIDQAGILMAQGSGIACERIQGVNDNMSQSHYHEYYEIYYLEAGERFHMVEDKLYKMEAGEFIIFPPYVMHHSYGAENMPFKRVLLYFSQEEILWPSILSELREEGGIYKVGIKGTPGDPPGNGAYPKRTEESRGISRRICPRGIKYAVIVDRKGRKTGKSA